MKRYTTMYSYKDAYEYIIIEDILNNQTLKQAVFFRSRSSLLSWIKINNTHAAWVLANKDLFTFIVGLDEVELFKLIGADLL